MKKITSLILIFAVSMLLVSCSEKNSQENETENQQISTTTEKNAEQETTQASGELQEDVDTAVGASSLIEKKETQAGCRATRYDMDIHLDTVEHSVSGTAKVSLVNNTDGELSELCFRLFSPALTPESAIISAKNSESGLEYEISQGTDATVVYVALGEDKMPAGGVLQVDIGFISYIPQIEDRFSYAVFENGSMYNMNFCFPQIAFLDEGKWFTAEYLPTGEALYNEMSDYYVTFSAPEDYVVLASGKQETNGGVTVIEAENVREMAITACNFAHIEQKEVDGVTFNLLRPDYQFDDVQLRDDLFALAMETAVESVEIFSDKVGDYIYDELDIVPLALENVGGMEMPGFVYVKFPHPSVYSDENTENNEKYIAPCELFIATTHEVAHQWFYCAVGNDQYHETWLDESFASYLEYYFGRNSETASEMYDNFYKEYCDGFTIEIPEYYETDYMISAIKSMQEAPDSGELPLWCDKEKTDGIPYINFPADAYEPDMEYIFIYCFGENFLHALEDSMGEESFFEMLSDWYEENLNSIVEGYQFVQHVLEYDSSDEVKEIINAYISADNLK